MGWSFDAWASVWLHGHSFHGCMYHWIKHWYAAIKEYPEQIHFIQYEKLKENARNEIEKLAIFLNVNFTDEMISRVLENSSFDSMKAQSAANGGEVLGHLRSGKVGGWRHYFTNEALKQEFIDKFDRELSGSGLVLTM